MIKYDIIFKFKIHCPIAEPMIQAALMLNHSPEEMIR